MRGTIRRWRTYFPRWWRTHDEANTLIYFVFVFALLLILSGALFYYALGVFDPRIVSTADIHAEQLSFRVVDTRKAAFFIAGAKIGTLGNDSPAECQTGLFTPARETTITYARIADEPLEITITPLPKPAATGASPAGSLEPAGAKPAVQYRGATFILLDPACNPPKSTRLPIWGQLQIGQGFRPATSVDGPEPSFLLGGTVSVFAHAIRGGSLYQVTTIEIPVGSQIQSLDADPSPDQSRIPIWWGTATVTPDTPALVVAAATEAPKLALYRPNQTVADIISLSSLAQVKADPTFILSALLFAFLTFLIKVCMTAARNLQKYDVQARDPQNATAPPPPPT